MLFRKTQISSKINNLLWRADNITIQRLRSEEGWVLGTDNPKQDCTVQTELLSALRSTR